MLTLSSASPPSLPVWRWTALGESSINILTPPVLALLAWNLAVYTLLAVGRIVHFGDLGASGPLRHALTRIASGLKKPHAGGELGEPLARFADDWARAAAPLYGVRAARILQRRGNPRRRPAHLLYLRGLAFEYRATWKAPSSMPTVCVACSASRRLQEQCSPVCRFPGSTRSQPFAHPLARMLHAGCI